MKLKKILMVFVLSLFVFTLAACNNMSSNGMSRGGDSGEGLTTAPGSTTTTQPTTAQNVPFSITPATGWTKVGNVYTITTALEDGYTISGTLIGGQIIFAADIGDSCDLFLNNVYLRNDTLPVIVWNRESKKVATKSLANTTNTFISGTLNDGLDISTIVSENNIDIGGDGVTNIISNSKHALDGSNIDLKSNGGTGIINIEAASDGVHGKEVTISSGTVNISNCATGIDAAQNTSLAKGTLACNGGTLTIEDCDLAIEAETSVTVGALTYIINCTARITSPSIVVSAANKLYYDGVAQSVSA